MTTVQHPAAPTTSAARRRRLGTRVAMVGTLTGLMTSFAVPAMAATSSPATTTEAVSAHVVTVAAPKAAPKTAPKAPPKGAPKGAPKSTSPQELELAAFADAGYGYADAQALASYWHAPSPYQAKLIGGAKIKAGLKLPFLPKAAPKAAPKTPPKAAPKTAPKGGSKAAALKAEELAAFADAGYGYADAQALASYWHAPSPHQAKLIGGAKIKAGLKLPFPPKAAPKAAPKAPPKAAPGHRA